MNFANLSANLSLNIAGFSAGLRTASAQVTSFGSKLHGRVVDPMKEVNDQTHKWGLNIKSVSQVVSGIIISQAFYSILRSVREATDAVWEFTKQLEYAQIAYSNLFGSTELADEFVNVLKDFAAKTPFSFTEAEAASKRLLAYGIQYKNVMYVMQGVMSAAAIQGDPTKIEAISRAFGQIYTYGKLMTQEVRQLSEAGIPAYEILQEELGLTQDQLRNLGNEAIPASVAINALVDGIQKRFGNVTVASAKTIEGIVSNIKDNATMLASGLAEPLTKFLKSGLAEVGELLFNLRDTFETSGAGGVLEAIVPPELLPTVRQFIATFSAWYKAVARLWYALGGLLKPVLVTLMNLYNAFYPIYTTFVNVIAYAVQAITSNATAMKALTVALSAAAAMWVVYKLKAIAAAVVTKVIAAIGAAIKLLGTAMTFAIAHPFWALLIGLTGILIGVAVGFDKVGEKVSGFFKKLTSFNGVDTDKLLLPSQKERANDLDKFNQKLDGTSDAMDDLADSTGKATKAAKNLLSFDEVFKLNEPDEGTEEGIQTEDLSGLFEGLSTEGYVPDVPDFSTYVNDFVGGYTDAFKDIMEKLKEKLPGIIGGAGLGGVIGALIGGVTGAKVGAAIGAVAGYFWDTLAEKIGLGETTALSLPIGAGIGAAIGMAAGGPGGAAIGAAIGGLVGFIGGELITGFSTGNWNVSGLSTAIGTGLGAAIGLAVGGPAGAAIGAAIGALVGWLGGKLAENWDKIWTAWDNMIVGMYNSTVEAFSGAKEDFDNWIDSTASAIVDWWFNTKEGFNTWVQETSASFDAWVSGVGTSITTWYENTRKAVSDWITETSNNFTTWVQNTSTNINNWVTGISDSISTWYNNTKTSVSNWITETYNNFTTWVQNTSTNFNNWVTGVSNSISTWYSNTKTSVSNWITETYNNFTTWVQNTSTKFNDWVTGVGNSITTWYNNTKTSVSNWITETYNNFTTWVNNTSAKFNTWYTNVKTVVSNWITETKSTIAGWVTTTANNISQWTVTTKTKLDTWYTNTKNGMSNWISTMKTNLKNWWSSLWDPSTWTSGWDKIKGWFSNIITSIGNWFSSLKNTIKNWWSNLWDGLSANTSTSSYGSGSSFSLSGHASGGVFNREHIARFAEGNRAEAIIPLENQSAMQPFVDAVSNGLLASLMPVLATAGGPSQEQLPPVYVGTLIADEKGLKELERKMRVIRLKEEKRGNS